MGGKRRHQHLYAFHLHRGTGGRADFCRASERFCLALADFWNVDLKSGRRFETRHLRSGSGSEAITSAWRRPTYCAIRRHCRTCWTSKIERRNSAVPADEEISLDFLHLVRFGLRSANDPLIRDSITAVDALLKTDTPNGPAWHRYNGDGYGEHDDGRPFDGTGRGRAWPLLTGERGHYELVAGNDPSPYLKAMAAMTGPGGMMPEQVWDSAALPERRLFPGGRPARPCHWPGPMRNSSS